MSTGLVFGKFMPLHRGHLALVDFAIQHCDDLYVVLCHNKHEPIDGNTRFDWLQKKWGDNPRIHLVSFSYDEKELPNTSISSKTVSAVWAEAFKKLLPPIDIVFTSEKYGDYVAEFLGIEHRLFDEPRIQQPISASKIRQYPLRYWDFIAPEARSHFVKKIVLVGTESTGKSTLTEKLAQHFNTSFVPEMARDIIEKTEECKYEDLIAIAALHAKTITEKLPVANKLLFVDTDLRITRSFSQFLFHRPLEVESWIEDANRFDCYLFLQPECPFVQDGTRLPADERLQLSKHHLNFYKDAGMNVHFINGNWQQRFDSAVAIVNLLLNKNG